METTIWTVGRLVRVFHSNPGNLQERGVYALRTIFGALCSHGSEPTRKKSMPKEGV